MDTEYIVQLALSLSISICMAIWFIVQQTKEYHINMEAIEHLKNFFSKKEGYSTYDSITVDADTDKSTKSVVIKNVANDDAELKSLIQDINAYIRKSKGTVAFSIIQNKTERRISMLYEIATSKLSFPTHIGLMGTFAGVFVGLLMFLGGTLYSGEITDANIQSLIAGVLVSMITSWCGISRLISSHRAASEATNQIDRDKNEFYEWVQNELMPSVDVSMVEAIGKLHETIDQFEPTFSKVIVEFKDAFKNVTGAFGNEFRQSVQVVASAVDTMGQNMKYDLTDKRKADEKRDSIRQAGLLVQNIIYDLEKSNSDSKNIKFLVVIEGQSSKIPFNDNDWQNNETLSFLRAKFLRKFWTDPVSEGGCGLFQHTSENDADSKCEIIVAGSGEGGVPRYFYKGGENPITLNPNEAKYKTINEVTPQEFLAWRDVEQQNQRFLINIIPIIGNIDVTKAKFENIKK